MNIKLLGILLALIGVVFGYYSMTQRDLATQRLAGMQIQSYVMKTSGKSFRKDLESFTVAGLEKDRDSAKQQMMIGWILAAIGAAVLIAGKKSA